MSSRELFNLSEIFTSFQGEGRYISEPSFFIRSSGCNLRCRWGDSYCDTIYTSWEAEQNFTSIDQLISKFELVAEQNDTIKHLIITGGEPLLQKNLAKVCDLLSKKGYYITIETNASIYTDLEADFISMSPKLSSSTPVASRFEEKHETLRLNYEAIRQWQRNYDYQLKFVINEASDEDEILDLLAQIEPSEDKVYLMPQGLSRDELLSNSELTKHIAAKHGWHYTPRLHVESFGLKRGC